MRTGTSFVLMYSITSRATFDSIANYRYVQLIFFTKLVRDQILRVKDVSYVPMVLCGNKCDLESERQVTAAEGEALARSWKIPFYETSAKNRINVEEAIQELCRRTKNRGGEFKLVMQGDGGVSVTLLPM